MSNLKAFRQSTKRCLVTAEVDFNISDGHVQSVKVERLFIQPTQEFLEHHRLYRLDNRLSRLGFEVLATGLIAAAANATSLAAMNEAVPIELSNKQILQSIEFSPEQPPEDALNRCLARIEESDGVEYYVIARYDDGETGRNTSGWYFFDVNELITAEIKGYILL